MQIPQLGWKEKSTLRTQNIPCYMKKKKKKKSNEQLQTQ